MQKKKSRPARAETPKKVAQTVGDSLDVDPNIWLTDEPSIWFIGGRGYQGLTNTPAIVQRAKEAYPRIYRKIEATTDVSNPRLESIAEAIITELRESAPADRLKAINLVYEAATVIKGNQFSTTKHRTESSLNVRKQEEIVELLANSISCHGDRIPRAAIKALGPFVDDWKVLIVQIAAKVGINHIDAETAISAMYLLDAAGPDAASLAVPALCTAAQEHKAWEVREEACNTLRDLGEKTQEVLTTLVRMAVGDASQTVRLAAVRAFQKLFKPKIVAEKLREAASDISMLIADLAEGGTEFRQLRRRLQKVYELPVSDQPDSRSTPCPTIPRETLEAAGQTSLEPPADQTDKTSQKLAGSADTDGPQPPNKFVWDRKCAELPPIPWKLVNFVWYENHQTAEVDDVFDAVWGHNAERSSNALKSAIGRANNSLLEKRIPITVNQKAGHVVISIAEN